MWSRGFWNTCLRGDVVKGHDLFGKAVLQVVRGGRGMSGNPSSEADKEDGFPRPLYFLVLLLRWGWWNRWQLIKRISESLLFSAGHSHGVLCCRFLGDPGWHIRLVPAIWSHLIWLKFWDFTYHEMVVSRFFGLLTIKKFCALNSLNGIDIFQLIHLCFLCLLTNVTFVRVWLGL